MKSKITFLSILSVMVAFAASAQNVEQDDMYFRSKDRVVLAASKPLTINANTASRASEVNSPINPTDSYSARNVNPEYISQAKVNPSSTALAETSAYFIPNYTPTTVNQNISNTPLNSNYSGGYGPSYYGMNSMMGYGMNSMMGYGMSGFGNPCYSPMGYYDPFGYSARSYNGYYNYGGGGFGYSPSLSFSMGMGFGYGAYNNYGYGGGYNPYYGNNVIVVNSADANGRSVVYGKRSSRSNDINNNVTSDNRSTMTDNSSQNAVRSSSSGRVASTSDNSAGSYYQRGWRTNPETNSRASWNNSVNSSSNSFFNNSGNTGRSSNSDFNSNSNSRSSWSGGNNSNVSTGGSRSSVSSSGGSSSSSGGARRGRD